MRSRPTLAAATIYLLLALVFLVPGVATDRAVVASDQLYTAVPWAAVKPDSIEGLGANYELTDQATQFIPMLRFTRADLPHVPLWNPHIMGGRPFVGNAQSAVFSPFSVPSYVLPFWQSFEWAFVLKLWLAAFGTFLLARALGMRFGGALLAGTVFAFGTFFVVWLVWPLTSIFCFIPWLLLLTELLIRRPGPLPVAGLAAVTALHYFGGHPESNVHVMFATCLWFVFRLWVHARGKRRAEGAAAPAGGARAALRPLVRPTLCFVAALVLGFTLAAVAVAPFVELLVNSGDLDRRLGNEERSFWPKRFIGALFLHDYWGRPTQTAIEPFTSNRGWYAGALTLMLAAAALIVRRSATRLAFVAFALLSTCMVIGIAPVDTLVEELPGFKTAHNERMLIFVLFALAMLAGWGLDDLSEWRPPDLAERRPWARTLKRAVLAAAGVIVIVPVVWMAIAGTITLDDLGGAFRVAWLFEHPPPLDFPPTARNADVTALIRMSALLMWLPLALLGFGLIAWRLRDRRPLAAGLFATLALLLLVADLFRANMGFNPAIPVDHARQPDTPAIDYLQSRRPQRFVGLGTEFFTQPIPADTAMNHGLYDARGYDYPVEKRFDRLWRRNVAPGIPDFTQPVAFAERTPAAIRALGLLSVSDLVVGPREPALRREGLSVGYRGPDAVVYANERALPRTFLVDRQRVVPGEEAALAAVTAPGFDGRRVAVTEEPLPGIPREGARGPAGPPGTARLTRYDSERVTIEADAGRRALLVLTDIHFPGWTAKVDGEEVDIERVDYLLRGIPLGPGRHTVELAYEPWPWRVGWIVSLLSLAVLLALVVAGLRGRRRAPAA